MGMAVWLWDECYKNSEFKDDNNITTRATYSFSFKSVNVEVQTPLYQRIQLPNVTIVKIEISSIGLYWQMLIVNFCIQPDFHIKIGHINELLILFL